MRRRADNHTQSMIRELDSAFFAQAATEGTAFTPASGVTAIQNILESMIQTLETTKNDNTDGVDRGLMACVLSPAKYGEIRTFLDTQSNPSVDTAGEEFGMYHGVRVYSCTRLPAKTNALLMTDWIRRPACCDLSVWRAGEDSAVQRYGRVPVLRLRDQGADPRPHPQMGGGVSREIS